MIVPVGNTTVPNVIPEREGYIFSHWEAIPVPAGINAINKHPGQSFIIANSMHFYAHWVAINNNNNGNIELTPPIISIPEAPNSGVSANSNLTTFVATIALLVISVSILAVVNVRRKILITQE